MSRIYAWASFLAWAAVGAVAVAALLAAFAIPVMVGGLVIAGAGAAALGSRPLGRVGIPGAVAGLAAPFLLIAYLNRLGPGEVCVAHEGAMCTGVSEQWSPWPWLFMGLLLLGTGVVVFVRTSRARVG